MAGITHDTLVAYVKNEDEVSDENLKNDIENCSGCQDRLKEISDHLDLYQQLPSFNPSPQLWNNLKTEIEKETQTVPPTSAAIVKWRKPYFVLAAAAMFLLAICTLGYYQYISHPAKMSQGIAELSSGQMLKGLWQGRLGNDTVINTNKDTTATFHFSKNITCSLGFDTKTIFHNPSLISLTKGEAFFQVASGTPLRIKTPMATVDVRGTSFHLVATIKRTLLHVYEGEIKFSPRDQKPIIIRKGSLDYKNQKLQSMALQTSSFPRWLTKPFSISLPPPNNNKLSATIKNLSPYPLNLHLSSGSTPLLTLHIKQNTHSYTTPLFVESKRKKIYLAPGEITQIKSDISKVLTRPGNYAVKVVYQGRIPNWEHSISSPAVTIVKR